MFVTVPLVEARNAAKHPALQTKPPQQRIHWPLMLIVQGFNEIGDVVFGI